jgi:hypothetical protein
MLKKSGHLSFLRMLPPTADNQKIFAATGTQYFYPVTIASIMPTTGHFYATDFF